MNITSAQADELEGLIDLHIDPYGIRYSAAFAVMAFKARHPEIVRGKITDTAYLVRYFEWVVGMPNIMQVVELAIELEWDFIA
jgi:hypothetical protein